MSDSVKDNDIQQNNPEETVQAIKTTEFMKETIKQRPINKRKLMRRLLITVGMAVIFGLVACFTILIIEPIITERLNPKEEEKLEKVTFVEETIEEETKPEDMIALEAELNPPVVEMVQTPVDDSQIEEVVSQMQLELGLEDFISLSDSLSSMAKEIQKSLVSVISITRDRDWFDNEYSSEDVVSGVLIADNGRDYLILANLSVLDSTESLEVEFIDGRICEASLLMQDACTGFGVVAVNKSVMNETTLKRINLIEMGSTANSDFLGAPVVALGRPMGMDGSVGIGHITSSSTVVNKADGNYKYLTTDICGSENASGILVNAKGQLLGMVDMVDNTTDMKGMVCGLAISDLKKMVEKMSNGNEIPYLGIFGIDVTASISLEMGIPQGVYITTMNMDSPLLDVGVQSGDIITKFNGVNVISFQEVNNSRLSLNPEDVITMEVQREGPEGYMPIDLEVTLSHQIPVPEQ